MADDDHIEEWRPVVGWEGLYSVSSWGRVRREASGRGTRVGLLLATPPNSSGYPRVNLYRGRSRTQVRVHRLVAAAFLGDRPGMQVNHKDFDRANARPGNLEYVTAQENIAYTARAGRVPRGEQHPKARLTRGAVWAIRTLLAAGNSRRRVARRFGVHPATVQGIAEGRNWGWLA